MINLVPCRKCKKLPLLTLRYDAKNYADIRCDCTGMSTPNDPTGEKTAKWWNKTQEPPAVTNGYKMKKVPCPECDGRGYVNKYSYSEDGTANGVSCYNCGNCNGTGEIEVPMTNLDWIKTMATAEEVVDFLKPCTPEAMAMWCEHFDNCRDCKVAWLNSKRRE